MMDVGGNVYVGPYTGGSNARRWMPDFNIVASLGADEDVWYIFQLLAGLTDSMKAVLTRSADATTGNARLDLSWAAAAQPVFDTLSLSAEGVQTLSWGAGDSGDLIRTEITLDAATAPTVDQFIVIQLGFETASWTLAQASYWALHLIDEA